MIVWHCALVSLMVFLPIRAEAMNANDDQWRWWFLGTTKDAATIALYDSISTKYLHISDLRALREDLDPLYESLADSIASAADAHKASLLIRLFHYSAARPYRTGLLCERIASNLAGYLLEQQNRDVELLQSIEMWTAVDLGTKILYDRQEYLTDRTLIDHDVLGRVLTARYLTEGCTQQDRFRLFIQTLDGITKHLAFNNLVDTAYALQVTSRLHWLMDSVSKISAAKVRPMPSNDDREWLLIYRFMSALGNRLYRDLASSAFAERQAVLFCLQTSVRMESCEPSFPEIRLRSQILGYMTERPFSRKLARRLTEGFGRSRLLPYCLLVELADGGAGMFLLNSLLVRQAVISAPLQMGSITDTSIAVLSDLLIEQSKAYCEAGTSQFPQILVPGRRRDTEASDAVRGNQSNVILDRFYQVRMALNSIDHDDVVNARTFVSDAIMELTDSTIGRYPLRKAVQLAIIRDAFFDWTSDQRSALKTFHWNLSYELSKDLLRNTSPWITTSKINEYRQEMLKHLRHSQHEMHDTISSTQTHYMILLMLGQRASGTTSQRQLKRHGDSNKLGEIYHDTADDLWSVTLLNQLKTFDLAQYISGNKKIDRQLLAYLEELSETVMLQEQDARQRSYYAADGNNWTPDDSTLYISADVYYRQVSSSESQARTTDTTTHANFVFTLHTADTTIQYWDVSDTVVAEAITVRLRGLSYGVVKATGVDSIYGKLIDAVQRNATKRYRRIVFLPSSLLYMHNPYLTLWKGGFLADSFYVSVSASLHHDRQSMYGADARLFVMSPDSMSLSRSKSERSSLARTALLAHWTYSLLPNVSNEEELAAVMQATDILHVTSHASQANALVMGLINDSSYRELFIGDEVSATTKRIWSPLIQYSSVTRDSGSLYADGYVSPIEFTTYRIKVPRMVYLSTCQTVSATCDMWEPPDGIIRELFSMGADCIVSAPLAIPDKYAAGYSKLFYSYLAQTGSPDIAATMVVRNRKKGNHESALSFGAYFPILFKTY